MVLAIDIGRYCEQSIARIRTHPALSAPSRGHAHELARAHVALHFDRERFFTAFDLRASSAVKGRLWRSGPELAGVFETSRGRVRLERRRIASTDGRDLDPVRTVLLLEYQQLLLDVVGSLQANGASDIVALTSAVTEDAAVARTVMRLASLDEAGEGAGLDVESACRFHERLVLMLRRQLLATYETAPAEMGIAFVSTGRAKPLRVRAVPERWIALLESSKLGRVLSDGRETHFVFSSSGEYLGLYDRPGLRARGFDPDALFGWQLRAGRGLVLHRGGEPVFELRGGRWTFRQDARLRERIERTEPTLTTTNRGLWEIASRLSVGHMSGILLIVDEAEALAASGTCRLDLALVPRHARTARRTTDEGAPRDPEQSGHLGVRAPLEDYLLDQLQGRTVDEIGIAILLKLATVDGALLVDRGGRLLGFGVIFATGVPASGLEGAGTNAARFASRFGTVIQVSADGPISAYRHGVAL